MKLEVPQLFYNSHINDSSACIFRTFYKLKTNAITKYLLNSYFQPSSLKYLILHVVNNTALSHVVTTRAYV